MSPSRSASFLANAVYRCPLHDLNLHYGALRAFSTIKRAQQEPPPETHPPQWQPEPLYVTVNQAGGIFTSQRIAHTPKAKRYRLVEELEKLLNRRAKGNRWYLDERGDARHLTFFDMHIADAFPITSHGCCR